MSTDTTLDVVLLANNTAKVFTGNNSINIAEIVAILRPTLSEQDAYKQYIGLGGFNVYYR